MNIGLVDVDGGKKFPNICLMKISAWHKSKGDNVEWADPLFGEYDIVYMSKVFSFSPDDNTCYNTKKIIKGGSGYAITLVDGREVYDKSKDTNLPDEIEHIYPDYSIYPELTKDTAFGFLSRGCPRGCFFCHVKSKEGQRAYKVADLSEFWSGQKNIVLCDPNILACCEWSGLLQQLIDSGAYVDLNQGIDARLITDEKAEMLSRIKLKEIHFAWDRYQDKEYVLRGLEIFARHYKKKLAHNCIVFTIVNFDTTIEQDLDRVYTLRKLGYWAYIMIYDKEHCAPIYKKLQRWVNNRFIFGACDNFDNYLKKY